MPLRSAVTAKHALTRTGGFLDGFSYSLNPYIGCGFGAGGGCPYCYVRMLPVARTVEAPWGAWVVAKSNLPELLEREMAALDRSDKLAQTTIFMSSATDPYQGIERRQRLTRGALEVMLRHSPRRLLLQTRSPLVERDIDLLARMGRSVIVSLTLETDDDSVRRAITPTSPSIARRIQTAIRLRSAGIFVQLAISPMMPNNSFRMAEIAERAADRVVVDTFFDGDGSGGRRSRALGIGELYARLGYEGWFERGAEHGLIAVLRNRLGSDRVLISRIGFNAV